MKSIAFTPDQEQEVLAREESHFFDFKRAEIAPQKLEALVVAFANADGGEAYIGIDDDTTLAIASRFFGFAKPEDANQHIAQVTTGLQPSIDGLSLDFVQFPSAGDFLVLRISVPKSPCVHYTSAGECFVRRGAQSIRIKGKQVESLIFTKGQRSFEDTVSGLRVKELVDGDYIHEYLKLVPTAQPAETFLRKQRLLDGEDQNHFQGPRVLVAGVLLFDDEPATALATKCSIKISRLNTSSDEYKREYLDGHPETIEGPIAVVIERAVRRVTEIMQDATFKVRGKYAKLRYPPEAVHEVIVNAVLHRDYSLKDDIQIFVYDNRIEVVSPGKLPGHITLGNILEERFSRNPKLVRGVNRLPDPPNRDIGEGLNTAFDKMRAARLKDPVIQETESAVRVVLRHESIASPEEQVIEYLRDKGEITNRKGRQLTGIRSENTMKNVFARMLKAELIEPVDPKSSRFSRRYRLASGWESRWRSSDS